MGPGECVFSSSLGFVKQAIEIIQRAANEQMNLFKEHAAEMDSYLGDKIRSILSDEKKWVKNYYILLIYSI